MRKQVISFMIIMAFLGCDSKVNYEKALGSDHWELLIDGEGQFFHVIRLKFEDKTLTEIYRHRKYFELP